MSNKERDRYRAEHRRYLESACGGVSEKEDFEDIYRIQKGRSYFSGDPIDPDKLNASVDHLTPVRLQGSFWPNNLVYVTREENQEKHGRSKAQYWSYLEKKNGTDWVNERKIIAKQFDVERGAIHRKRRREVKKELKEMESTLAATFPDVYITLELSGDNLMMYVDGAIVCYRSDFLRKKRRFKDMKIYNKVVRALIPSGKEVQLSQVTVGQPNCLTGIRESYQSNAGLLV